MDIGEFRRLDQRGRIVLRHPLDRRSAVQEQIDQRVLAILHCVHQGIPSDLILASQARPRRQQQPGRLHRAVFRRHHQRRALPQQHIRRASFFDELAHGHPIVARHRLEQNARGLVDAALLALSAIPASRQVVPRLDFHRLSENSAPRREMRYNFAFAKL